MLSTTVLIASLVYLLVAEIILWCVFLNWGLRWVGSLNTTWRRLLAVAVGAWLVSILLQLAIMIVFPSSRAVALAASVAILTATATIQCALISWACKLSPLRSIQAWLPTLVPAVAAIGAAQVFKLLLFQAYFAPTNSMAPTLLGNHWVAECAECGQASVCTPERFPRESMQMICPNFHVTEHASVEPKVFGPDHFLVCRFLQPQRWDTVAFMVPSSPESLTVKRLVGLPGETIEIKEGAVWANGQRLTPPREIGQVLYLSELPSLPWGLPALWGSDGNPAALGPDEYFVLGDFSAQSSDSRVWEAGAPGHNAFAVPQSHVVGVVTHIYWPPQRWRIIR